MKKYFLIFLFFLFFMNLKALELGNFSVKYYQSVCECDDESMLPDLEYSVAIKNEYVYYVNYYGNMVHSWVHSGVNATAQFDKFVDDEKYLGTTCPIPLFCPVYGIDDSYSDHADLVYVSSDADLYQTGSDNFDVKFFLCSSSRMPNKRCHVNPENDIWFGEQSGDTHSANPGETNFLVLRATKSVPGTSYAAPIWSPVLNRSKKFSMVMGLANTMYDTFEAVPEGYAFATNVYYREQPWYQYETTDRVTLKQAWYLAVDAGPSGERGCAITKGSTASDAFYFLGFMGVYSGGLNNNGPYTSMACQN